MAAVLGGAHADAKRALIWVAVVFLSVLVHELGHALMARGFGFQPVILLYSMGGLTSWAETHQIGEGRRILISGAGPMAGFLLGGIVIALAPAVPEDASVFLRIAIRDLIWVNIGWGLLNLLPILPLDGGHIMRSSVQVLRGGKPSVLPFRISFAASVVICALALYVQMIWGAILAGWLAYNNYRALRAESARGM